MSKYSLWHDRLGHIYDTRLQVLKPLLGISDVSRDDSTCIVCPNAKQRRLPFISDNKRVDSPFELTHCDIWGPFHVETVEGYKYFLTVVDDYSRAILLYIY